MIYLSSETFSCCIIDNSSEQLCEGRTIYHSFDDISELNYSYFDIFLINGYNSDIQMNISAFPNNAIVNVTGVLPCAYLNFPTQEHIQVSSLSSTQFFFNNIIFVAPNYAVAKFNKVHFSNSEFQNPITISSQLLISTASQIEKLSKNTVISTKSFSLYLDTISSCFELSLQTNFLKMFNFEITGADFEYKANIYPDSIHFFYNEQNFQIQNINDVRINLTITIREKFDYGELFVDPISQFVYDPYITYNIDSNITFQMPKVEFDFSLQVQRFCDVQFSCYSNQQYSIQELALLRSAIAIFDGVMSNISFYEIEGDEGSMLAFYKDSSIQKEIILDACYIWVESSAIYLDEGIGIKCHGLTCNGYIDLLPTEDDKSINVYISENIMCDTFSGIRTSRLFLSKGCTVDLFVALDEGINPPIIAESITSEMLTISIIPDNKKLPQDEIIEQYIGSLSPIIKTSNSLDINYEVSYSADVNGFNSNYPLYNLSSDDKNLFFSMTGYPSRINLFICYASNISVCSSTTHKYDTEQQKIGFKDIVMPYTNQIYIGIMDNGTSVTMPDIPQTVLFIMTSNTEPIEVTLDVSPMKNLSLLTLYRVHAHIKSELGVRTLSLLHESRIYEDVILKPTTIYTDLSCLSNLKISQSNIVVLQANRAKLYIEMFDDHYEINGSKVTSIKSSFCISSSDSKFFFHLNNPQSTNVDTIQIATSDSKRDTLDLIFEGDWSKVKNPVVNLFDPYFTIVNIESNSSTVPIKIDSNGETSVFFKGEAQKLAFGITTSGHYIALNSINTPMTIPELDHISNTSVSLSSNDYYPITINKLHLKTEHTFWIHQAIINRELILDAHTHLVVTNSSFWNSSILTNGGTINNYDNGNVPLPRELIVRGSFDQAIVNGINKELCNKWKEITKGAKVECRDNGLYAVEKTDSTLLIILITIVLNVLIIGLILIIGFICIQKISKNTVKYALASSTLNNTLDGIADSLL